MARIKMGDIIEIRTPEAFAYAQYINRHQRYGALIRVYSQLRDCRPTDMSEVLEGDVQFMCFFPLQAAINREIVSAIGNVGVPADASEFPVFRAGVVDPATGKVGVWWFWDGEKEWRVGSLSEEQRSMPIRGVWNDTILIERVVSGWRAENDPAT